MRPEPFLPEWNLHVLHELFLLLPHNGTVDSLAQFLTLNALTSSWIYAAVFYAYWRIEDEHRIWRRTRLLEIFIAFCIALLTTLAFWPWVGWPAPVLVPRFRELYPTYFWINGNSNCFPSHSTLVYFIIAAGFWSFNRRFSALLMLLVLLLISLPRIYVGGHYPVDVIAAILLAATAAWATRRICARPRVSVLLTRTVSKGLPVEVPLFLWLFELGDGFRSSYWILRSLSRAARNIWH